MNHFLSHKSFFYARRHPLIKELNHRVQKNKEDTTTKDLANVLFETATLRSGFSLQETASFAERIERMLRLSLDVPLDAKVSRISSLPRISIESRA